MNVVDLFAGPGGWDVAARELGLDPLGIEFDDAACETREAAGLRTRQADVSSLDPDEFAPVDLLIASPPCQAFSRAGKREGIADLPLVWEAAKRLAAGDVEGGVELDWRDHRSELVLEPLRWALFLEPELLAWEQVPDVLDFWRFCGQVLEARGWRAWSGLVEAERYGVPQTRERAILLASRSADVGPPHPTHQRYVKGEPQRHEVTLDGEILPWVSMAEALGWDPADKVGFPRRNDGDDGGEYRERDLRPASEPAFALSSKARSWVRFRSGNQENATERAVEEPAPTIAFGHNAARVEWVDEEENVERVSLEEAAVLQSFNADYPFRGARSRRFQQIGNAVPPLLARAILQGLLP